MSPSEMALHVEQAVSEGRLSADDPRRLTPSGELKKPKFVKFLFEDSGAYLDEIFWEGEDGSEAGALAAVDGAVNSSRNRPTRLQTIQVPHYRKGNFMGNLSCSCILLRA